MQEGEEVIEGDEGPAAADAGGAVDDAGVGLVEDGEVVGCGWGGRGAVGLLCGGGGGVWRVEPG